MSSVYDYEVFNAKGEKVNLRDYQGKVLLIVNTASKCGFTPQYDGLEKLYKDYLNQGLVVLGFPCNQFGGQEPGSDQEIQEFCRLNHGVSFPVLQKIKVNGAEAAPLYEFLKSEAPGLLGSKEIKWNFTKFLVDRQGQVIKRFAPADSPDKMRAAIESALADG